MVDFEDQSIVIFSRLESYLWDDPANRTSRHVAFWMLRHTGFGPGSLVV